MATTLHNLTEWIIKLGAELRYLQHQAPYLEADTLEKKVKQHQQALQFIYRKAKQQQIDLIPYYQALAEIEANIKIIQSGRLNLAPREKIALFIDAANIDKISQKWLEKAIDYEKLLIFFSKNDFILRAYFYTGIENERDIYTNPFYYALRKIGYHLITKQIKSFSSGERKGNLDIEIALDMLELADKVDRVVLFSGDGDFAPVLKRIGKKGVRTEVVSYVGEGRNPTASELIDAADVFTDLADIVDQITMAEKG